MIESEIERLWLALPAWKRARLRIKQVVPEQRLWVKALYALACSGDRKAIEAMEALFDCRPRGQIVPRKGLRAPQQQRRNISPVALRFFIEGRLCRKE